MTIGTPEAAPSGLELTLGLLHQLLVTSGQSEPSLEAAHRIHVLLRTLTKQSPDQSLPSLMPRIRSQVGEALARIRRARDLLHAPQPERMSSTHARLDEVNKATESATLAMLNGLDRTLEIIDGLQQRSGAPDAGFDAMRDEVNHLYTHLQFQDIIAQQLAGVTASLVDLEQEIKALADLFNDGTSAPLPAALAAPRDPRAYNPDASTVDVERRQSVIDQTLRRSRLAR